MRPWTITWGEDRWTDESVTAGNVIAVADLLGRREVIDPHDGPSELSAWVIVLLASKRAAAQARISAPIDAGGLIAAASMEVMSAPASKFLDALTERVEFLPPDGDVASDAVANFTATGVAVNEAINARTPKKAASKKAAAAKRKR